MNLLTAWLGELTCASPRRRNAREEGLSPEDYPSLVAPRPRAELANAVAATLEDAGDDDGEGMGETPPIVNKSMSLGGGGPLKVAIQPPSSSSDDRKLIALLSEQLEQREPPAESMQMITNVAQLLARTAANRTAMLQELERFVPAVARHRGHAGVQECALGLFGNLACTTGTDAEGPRALLETGCLEHTVCCLQEHADHAGVQRNAYRCLRNVAAASNNAAETTDPKLVAFMVARRVPQVVAFMLHRHIGAGPVVEQALAALWALACTPTLARLLSESAAADGVLRVMARHTQSVDIQRCGCGVLVRLLDAEAQLRASSLHHHHHDEGAAASAPPVWMAPPRPFPAPAEIAPAVLAAAHAHAANPSVMALILEVLEALATSKRAPALQQAQLMSALGIAIHALASFEIHATVVEAACDFVKAAMPPADSALAALVHAELVTVVPLLDHVMRENDADAAAACSSLVAEFCQVRALRERQSRCGTLEAVVGVAHRFVSHAHAAEESLRAIRCMLSLGSPQCVDALVAANGIDVVLRVMTRHSASDDIAESGCSILWSCALHHSPLTLSPSSPALHAALVPLFASSRPVRVQQQACGLLCAVSLRPQHARALATPSWTHALQACAASGDATVLDYVCRTTTNLLSLHGLNRSASHRLAVAVAEALVTAGCRRLPRELLRHRVVPPSPSVDAHVRDAAAHAAVSRAGGGWTVETHRHCAEGLRRAVRRRLELRVALARNLPAIPYCIWLRSIIAPAMAQPDHICWRRLAAQLRRRGVAVQWHDDGSAE